MPPAETPLRAAIRWNRGLSPAYRHLGLSVPGFPIEAGAGRFVMLRPPAVGDPLLPRPFSLYRVSPGPDGTALVEILYKVVGKGTRHLAGLGPGQPVDLLGPLGNRFGLPEGGTAVLVAGGIGVPPIAALAGEIGRGETTGVRGQGLGVRGEAAGEEDPSTAHGPSSMVVFLGGRTAEDILCLDDFRGMGVEPRIATEDGSLGAPGLITDLLEAFLGGPRLTPHPSPLTLFACGPLGMLAAVARLAERRGVPCQVSVEAGMACGFGACMGCAIRARAAGPGRRYRLVCQDGPVFDAREIDWDPERRGAEGGAGGCGCHDS